MKKYFLILGLLVSVPSYATKMCAVNDSVAVVLDPTINGTEYSYDNIDGTWWTQFPYGRIFGISSCIDTTWGRVAGGTVPKMTDSKGNRVIGSEKNGSYCWCKITRPVSLFWVFINTFGSDTLCASRCTYYCGNLVQNDRAVRAGLFSTAQ